MKPDSFVGRENCPDAFELAFKSHIEILNTHSKEVISRRLRETYTPSPPTKSLGFEGFDSSRLLILRGGNSHVR